MLANYEKWLGCYPRWAVAVRTCLVIVGGYALSSALSLVLAKISGVQGNESNALMGLVFFLTYASCFVWWFSINTHSKVLIHVVVSNLFVWTIFYFTGALV